MRVSVAMSMVDVFVLAEQNCFVRCVVLFGPSPLGGFVNRRLTLAAGCVPSSDHRTSSLDGNNWVTYFAAIEETGV